LSFLNSFEIIVFESNFNVWREAEEWTYLWDYTVHKLRVVLIIFNYYLDGIFDALQVDKLGAETNPLHCLFKQRFFWIKNFIMIKTQYSFDFTVLFNIFEPIYECIRNLGKWILFLRNSSKWLDYNLIIFCKEFNVNSFWFWIKVKLFVDNCFKFIAVFLILIFLVIFHCNLNFNILVVVFGSILFDWAPFITKWVSESDSLFNYLGGIWSQNTPFWLGVVYLFRVIEAKINLVFTQFKIALMDSIVNLLVFKGIEDRSGFFTNEKHASRWVIIWFHTCEIPSLEFLEVNNSILIFIKISKSKSSLFINKREAKISW